MMSGIFGMPPAAGDVFTGLEWDWGLGMAMGMTIESFLVLALLVTLVKCQLSVESPNAETLIKTSSA